MEWLPMILPVLSVIICLTWYRNQTLWWEVAIPLGIVALFILIFKVSAESIAIRDTEYWNGYVTKAEYFEDWNERVSCRHPRYCTRVVTRGSGKNRYTTTERYQCGWQHPYDVDYHPEYWTKTDNNHISHHINRSEYQYFVKLFSNQSFVNLNRDYHTDDGDKYMTVWPGTDNSVDILVSEHSYENRVQASHSVFNYQDVDTSDIRKYGLYEYPTIDKRDHQRHVLGHFDKTAERYMEILNAKLGKKKEVKAFIAVYPGKTKKSAELQEAYWKGGNKNEFIVCIGTDKSKNKVTWVHIISWNLNKTLDVKVRNWVMKNKTFDPKGLSKYMYEQIESDFKRQPFSEFSYLEVDLTSGQLLAVWIISAILSIGAALFVILNPFEEK